MPKKPFVQGRKQAMETLLMYYWLHRIEGDENYWDEYVERILPFLQ
jgi:hypothetical protein